MREFNYLFLLILLTMMIFIAPYIMYHPFSNWLLTLVTVGVLFKLVFLAFNNKKSFRSRHDCSCINSDIKFHQHL